MPATLWYVIINENMLDAGAYVLPVAADSGPDIGLSGWERVWSGHDTKEEAEAALVEAKAHARTFLVPVAV